ncbi:MAG: helix-turn-helix domain-containing protein [Paraclostridium sp.]
MSEGLNSYRLKSIREYKGLTIKELSKTSYISEDRLRAIEGGIESGDKEVLMSLCNSLKCSMHDLTTKDRLGDFESNIFFRNQGYINKKEELAYVQKCIMVYRIYNFLSYYLKMPKLEKLKIDNKRTDVVALKLRECWELGQGPIQHILGALEKNGFIVCKVNPGKQKVQAFSQALNFEDNKVFIINIGNDNKSASRRNYDLVHELAHFILHEDINVSSLDKKDFDKIEKEADDFACEFLLPKESFLDDLVYPNDLEFYIQLKSKWIVPMWLLIKRSHDLGAISSRKYEYFIKEMKANGWDKKEPLDSNIKISDPVLTKTGIQVLLDNKIMTKNTLVKNLSEYGVFVDSYEIEQIVGMKKGSLFSENVTKKSNILTLKR